MDGMSLLDVLRGVMLDPAEQAVYDADPGAYLGQYGYQDVDAADLSEAFGLVADTLPADQAMAAWTGESGPESPLLGDDTVDFDVGDPADVLLAADDVGDDVSDPADDIDDLDGSDDLGGTSGGTDDTGDEPALSFGSGEDEGTEHDGTGPDDVDTDLGLFGAAAPETATAGADDDVDAAGYADEAFAAFAGDTTDAAHEAGFDDDLDGVDDTDDLAEIEGLGAVDHGPDDLDIGSF
jgi:hypothetical protein